MLRSEAIVGSLMARLRSHRDCSDRCPCPRYLNCVRRRTVSAAAIATSTSCLAVVVLQSLDWQRRKGKMVQGRLWDPGIVAVAR